MNKRISYILLSCILLFLTSCGIQKNDTVTQSKQGNTTTSKDTFSIRLSFDDKEMIAILEDNPTSQSFIESLPIDVYFHDFASAEKIASMQRELDLQPSLEGYDPSLYDIAYYAPWNNLVLYYKDQPYANGIYPMGQVSVNMEYINDIKENDLIRIEQYK